MHLADSANFKGVTSNKLCGVLTSACFESPNDTIHVTVTGKQCKTELVAKITFLPLKLILSRIKLNAKNN